MAVLPSPCWRAYSLLVPLERSGVLLKYLIITSRGRERTQTPRTRTGS